VSVRTPQADRLLAAFARTGIEQARIQRTGPDQLRVIGLGAAEVGRLALAERVELHQLITEHSGLEQTFFALTANADQQPDSTLKEAS
jgi:ABC-2 type transport system ATP-binding protein